MLAKPSKSSINEEAASENQIRFKSLHSASRNPLIPPETAVKIVNFYLSVYDRVSVSNRKITTTLMEGVYLLSFFFASPDPEDEFNTKDIIFDVPFLTSTFDPLALSLHDQLQRMQRFVRQYGQIAAGQFPDWKQGDETFGVLELKSRGVHRTKPHLIPPKLYDEEHFSYSFRYLRPVDAAICTNYVTYLKAFFRLVAPTPGLTDALCADFATAKAIAHHHVREATRQAKFRKELRAKRSPEMRVDTTKTRQGELVQYKTGSGLAHVVKCDVFFESAFACKNKGTMALVCRLALCCGRSYLHAGCLAAQANTCGHCTPGRLAVGAAESSDSSASASEEASADDHPEVKPPTVEAILRDVLMNETVHFLEQMCALFPDVAAEARPALADVGAKGVFLIPIFVEQGLALSIFTENDVLVFDPRQELRFNSMLASVVEASSKGDRELTYLRTYPYKDKLKTKDAAGIPAMVQVLRAAACVLRSFNLTMQSVEPRERSTQWRSLGKNYVLAYTHMKVFRLARVLVGSTDGVASGPDLMEKIIEGLPAPLLLSSKVRSASDAQANAEKKVSTGAGAVSADALIASDAQVDASDAQVKADALIASDAQVDASDAQVKADALIASDAMVDASDAQVKLTDAKADDDNDEEDADKKSESDVVMARQIAPQTNVDDDFGVYHPSPASQSGTPVRYFTEGLLMTIDAVVLPLLFIARNYTADYLRLRQSGAGVSVPVDLAQLVHLSEHRTTMIKCADIYRGRYSPFFQSSIRIPRVITFVTQSAKVAHHHILVVIFPYEKIAYICDSLVVGIEKPADLSEALHILPVLQSLDKLLGREPADVRTAEPVVTRSAETSSSSETESQVSVSSDDEDGKVSQAGINSHILNSVRSFKTQWMLCENLNKEAGKANWTVRYPLRHALAKQKDGISCGAQCMAMDIGILAFIAAKINVDPTYVPTSEVMQVVSKIRVPSNAYHILLGHMAALRHMPFENPLNASVHAVICGLLIRVVKEGAGATAMRFPTQAASWPEPDKGDFANNSAALTAAKREVSKMTAGTPVPKRIVLRTPGVIAIGAAAVAPAGAAAGGTLALGDAARLWCGSPPAKRKSEQEVIACELAANSDPAPCVGAVRVKLPGMVGESSPYRWIVALDALAKKGKRG